MAAFYMLVALGIGFIVLGALLRFKKWYWLIAGYNTMPEAERAEYDIDRIARLLAAFMVAMGMSTILFGLGLQFVPRIKILAIALYMIIAIAGSIALIAEANSSKFRKRP